MASTIKESPAELPLVAQRLNHLFDTVRPKGGGTYNPASVAEAINDSAGEKVIDKTYIWQLRKGRKDNPSYNVLILLSRFFGVSPLYFFPDEDDAQAIEPPLRAALSNPAIRDLVLLSVGLSDRSLEAIKAMTTNTRALEGLPE
jgi:transcriptional regulator with XRE-family HTH domain